MDSDEDTKDGIIVHPDDPVPWFPGQEEDQSPESDHADKPARLKRRKRCGQCGPCQIRKNCGECSNCLRRSVLKQSCIYRKCIYLRKPVSGSAKTPPRHRSNGTYFMSSSCDDDLDSSYELMSPPRIDINGFAVREQTNGDDTEILIEDYTPTPSIIIGGFDDEPQDSQPSSPIRIPVHRESVSQSSAMCIDERIKTPPHPMDCEDDDSCVNPRQFNAQKAIKEADSSGARTGTPETVSSVTRGRDVLQTTESYSLDKVQNGGDIEGEIDRVQDTHGKTDNSSCIQSDLEKDQSVLRSSLRQTRFSESDCVTSQQLSDIRPVDNDVETSSKLHNQTDTRADSINNFSGSVRLPVLQPGQHHKQTAFNNFHVPKPQSISATYDEAHRQFFSPPNVTVTGQGGFSSQNSSDLSYGSQGHKASTNPFASNDYDQYARSAHPAWYPGMPIHPHPFPQFGIPRGMYPPHYAFDPMVYPIHPTQNPFHRMGSHPINPVILPRMVPPRYYPYRRHPGDHQYRSHSPGSDPDFSKHPDFRKSSSSSSISRPNSGNNQSNEPTSAREEIEEYKKHSVFRLRANSLEKPRSPTGAEEERRSTPRSLEVSEQSSIPKNRNKALRQLLSHTSTNYAESRANTAVDEDLQNEMGKIGRNPCVVGNIDELRMPNLVRGDAINVESSSPNSSSSSESVSNSPMLVENYSKHISSSLTLSEQVGKSVKVEGNVCIKQDLGEEGIVMLEFQGGKVDLVQCVLDDHILNLSNNPQELKEYILNSQKTISNPVELPALSQRMATESDAKFPSHENFPPRRVEDSSKGVQALADICSSLGRQPPQLKKLGEIVGENKTEWESPVLPSEPVDKDKEGWKQSYLKIFSMQQQGKERTKLLATTENVTIPASENILNSQTDCRSDKWMKFINSHDNTVRPHQVEGQDNSETTPTSDKNIFNSQNSIQPEIETNTEKTENRQNQLKRILFQEECEHLDSKRFKPEIDLPVPAENGTVKSKTMVNSLTKVVENTIDSYTDDKNPEVVSECDSVLMCEEYQTDKISPSTNCDENNTVSSDHEFLSEKTIVELKKKILQRNS